MKVLIVHPSFFVYGGAEIVIRELVKYLNKHNIENKILTSTMIADIRDDINTEVIIPKEILTRELQPLDAFIKWMKENRKEYDVINYHNYPAHYLAKFIKCPNVWQCNEPSPRILKGQSPSKEELNVVQNHINKVTVFDEYNAHKVKIFYNKEATVNYYGIDYDFFSKGNRDIGRKEYGIKDNDFFIVQVGMIHPEKNQARTIQAVYNIIEYIPNIKLLLVGYTNHEYCSLLIGTIQKYNLQNHVQIKSHVLQEQLRDIYAGADLLIQPCTDHGGWLSPFEALCTGTPIVVSIL